LSIATTTTKQQKSSQTFFVFSKTQQEISFLLEDATTRILQRTRSFPELEAGLNNKANEF